MEAERKGGRGQERAGQMFNLWMHSNFLVLHTQYRNTSAVISGLLSQVYIQLFRRTEDDSSDAPGQLI